MNLSPTDPKPATCSHFATCPMFKVFSSESSGRIFTQFYCQGDFKSCARFQKSERGESVSDYLLPNGTILNAK